LRLWAEDFGSEKGMEKAECFVYCGFFITYFWSERFAQRPKGEFLEVPCSLIFKWLLWRGSAQGFSSRRSWHAFGVTDVVCGRENRSVQRFCEFVLR